MRSVFKAGRGRTDTSGNNPDVKKWTFQEHKERRKDKNNDKEHLGLQYNLDI